MTEFNLCFMFLRHLETSKKCFWGISMAVVLITGGWMLFVILAGIFGIVWNDFHDGES